MFDFTIESSKENVVLDERNSQAKFKIIFDKEQDEKNNTPSTLSIVLNLRENNKNSLQEKLKPITDALLKKGFSTDAIYIDSIPYLVVVGHPTAFGAENSAVNEIIQTAYAQNKMQLLHSKTISDAISEPLPPVLDALIQNLYGAFFDPPPPTHKPGAVMSNGPTLAADNTDSGISRPVVKSPSVY